jgi:hypothetical protein
MRRVSILKQYNVAARYSHGGLLWPVRGVVSASPFHFVQQSPQSIENIGTRLQSKIERAWSVDSKNECKTSLRFGVSVVPGGFGVPPWNLRRSHQQLPTKTPLYNRKNLHPQSLKCASLGSQLDSRRDLVDERGR